MKGTLGSPEVELVGNETFRGKQVLHAQATVSSSLLLKTRFDWKNQYTAVLTPGEDVSIPLLDKKNKIKTMVIKQSTPYDLTFKFAKDFSYIPIELGVMNVLAGNVHLSARCILSGYNPGK